MNATTFGLAVLSGMPWPLRAQINAAPVRQIFGPAFAALASCGVGSRVLRTCWPVARMGAAALVCPVVAGQRAGALLPEHSGTLHPRQPVRASRIAGLLRGAAGTLRVVKPWPGSAE